MRLYEASSGVRRITGPLRARDLRVSNIQGVTSDVGLHFGQDLGVNNKRSASVGSREVEERGGASSYVNAKAGGKIE